MRSDFRNSLIKRSFSSFLEVAPTASAICTKPRTMPLRDWHMDSSMPPRVQQFAAFEQDSSRFHGAGGGNRTIRAHSFYVTYCKHTNARTAQPAVCPPPMYKIMYKSLKAECVVEP